MPSAIAPPEVNAMNLQRHTRTTPKSGHMTPRKERHMTHTEACIIYVGKRSSQARIICRVADVGTAYAYIEIFIPGDTTHCNDSRGVGFFV